MCNEFTKKRGYCYRLGSLQGGGCHLRGPNAKKSLNPKCVNLKPEPPLLMGKKNSPSFLTSPKDFMKRVER